MKSLCRLKFSLCRVFFRWSYANSGTFLDRSLALSNLTVLSSTQKHCFCLQLEHFSLVNGLVQIQEVFSADLSSTASLTMLWRGIDRSVIHSVFICSTVLITLYLARPMLKFKWWTKMYLLTNHQDNQNWSLMIWFSSSLADSGYGNSVLWWFFGMTLCRLGGGRWSVQAHWLCARAHELRTVGKEWMMSACSTQLAHVHVRIHTYT